MINKNNLDLDAFETQVVQWFSVHRKIVFWEHFNWEFIRSQKILCEKTLQILISHMFGWNGVFCTDFWEAMTDLFQKIWWYLCIIYMNFQQIFIPITKWKAFAQKRVIIKIFYLGFHSTSVSFFYGKKYFKIDLNSVFLFRVKYISVKIIKIFPQNQQIFCIKTTFQITDQRWAAINKLYRLQKVLVKKFTKIFE